MPGRDRQSCRHPPFWTLPTQITIGTAAASGIALVNSLGNLSGFLAPRLLDLLRDGPGNFQSGLGVLAILPLAAMLLLIPLRRLRVVA